MCVHTIINLLDLMTFLKFRRLLTRGWRVHIMYYQRTLQVWVDQFVDHQSGPSQYGRAAVNQFRELGIHKQQIYRLIYFTTFDASHCLVRSWRDDMFSSRNRLFQLVIYPVVCNCGYAIRAFAGPLNLQRIQGDWQGHHCWLVQS